MKITKQFIIRIIFFFYLSSSYLSASHIHNDELEHHGDCKVCLLVKNLHCGDIPALEVITVSDFFNNKSVLFYEKLCIKNIYKGFNAHAPPLFS